MVVGKLSLEEIHFEKVGRYNVSVLWNENSLKGYSSTNAFDD